MTKVRWFYNETWGNGLVKNMMMWQGQIYLPFFLFMNFVIPTWKLPFQRAHIPRAFIVFLAAVTNLTRTTLPKLNYVLTTGVPPQENSAQQKPENEKENP